MTIPPELQTDFLAGLLRRTSRPAPAIAAAIIQKARAKKGLALEEVGRLLNLSAAAGKDSQLTEQLFQTAALVKREIYGPRLVLFAPLYISDYCVNDCAYCNFHTRNRELVRRKLTLSEVAAQTRFLINQGHKRLLLEFGEDPVHNPIDYIVKVIRQIYAARTPRGNIRRVNVNIAATTAADYRKLKAAGIGTYQLFQETYHRPTYEQLHRGPKADYERQIGAAGRAFAGGIEDVGLGALFGLYDWRFEVLALVAHSQYLERTYKVGPHTISVPRLRPAPTVTYRAAYPVSDDDFLRLIAILRLALPYVGMIISTRERPEIRRQAFQIGISQASAGSVTVTGGYGRQRRQPQFAIADERPLQEVIRAVMADKLIPSFCTACYRRGRTGERFMQLAKPGSIQHLCQPNALLTLAEYLADFTTDGLREKGYRLIAAGLRQITDDAVRSETERRLAQVRAGARDLYF
ncbi:MAG: [FeFe] hydrogenase H-cluster radical SAM maturase HydG [Lentisphaerae bacterium]|nr:[FeFe] hydrogenase H-cluster radical SAM maturase HydG [Lentisphaerota bacterium]